VPSPFIRSGEFAPVWPPLMIFLITADLRILPATVERATIGCRRDGSYDASTVLHSGEHFGKIGA
jgi:hypothetical protein